MTILIVNIPTYSFQFIGFHNRPADFDGPDITVMKTLRYPSKTVLYTKFRNQLETFFFH